MAAAHAVPGQSTDVRPLREKLRKAGTERADLILVEDAEIDETRTGIFHREIQEANMPRIVKRTHHKPLKLSIGGEGKRHECPDSFPGIRTF